MSHPKRFSTLLLLLGSLSLGFLSCTEEGEKETEVSFDQQSMLTNIGQNIIFPAYANFNTKASTLEERVHDFTHEPTTATLAAAQDALMDAYRAWQKVSLYEFGPAEEAALRLNVNNSTVTFSPDFPAIENDIAAGSWNLDFYSSLRKKGLPALDYLLFSGESQEAILEAYTTAEHAAARRQYLHDVTDQVAGLALEVYNGWAPEGGNYLGEFNTTTGNEAGSPLSLLVNQFNEGYEINKNKRLGIPAGTKSPDGAPIPLAVEAYYSGISLELLQLNLQNVEAVFKGEANGTDGPGLDDYIDAIYEAGNIQDDLTGIILGQFQNIHQAVNALPAPLSEAVVIVPDKAIAAYDEMANLVQYTKTDMPQALGVNISYFDNDGD